MNVRHGTYSAYKSGCRCLACSAYQAERNRRNRAERLAAGRLTHGTRSAYDAGCRCQDCKACRRRISVREWRQIQRERALEVAS